MVAAVDPEIRCLWAKCRARGPFPDQPALFEHLCAEHKPPTKRILVCRWRGCTLTAGAYQHADHLIRHTSYRPHCCTYPGCNKSFNHRPTLLQHSTQHDWSSVTAYPCNWSDCAAPAFPGAAELHAHLTETHAPAAVHGARCGWAGCRTTLDKRHINAHIATHLPPAYKPFRCTTCGKAFRTTGALKAHAFRTHGNAESARDENGEAADDCASATPEGEGALLRVPVAKRGRQDESSRGIAKRHKDLEGDSESELDIVITVKLEEPDTQAESLWAL